MGKKSLTEAAKGVLMKESNDPTPDRGAQSKTPNMQTLAPNGGPVPQEPDPKHNEAEDLGGATPTSLAKDNLGANASKKIGKDKSRSAQAAVPAEASPMAEDIEISEELENFIAECIEQGLTEDEIAEAIEANFEIITEDEDVDSEVIEEESEEESVVQESVEELKERRQEEIKEHVDALLEGEELSDEFRSKAETIFESAVSNRVNEEISVLEEAYALSLEEEVNNIRSELTEQIDDYLNYVVEQWISENEVAIESGLRTELTEEFISGLHNLFTEHYMDVPEEKVSVLEQLGNKVEQLEARLNEEIERNVELSKNINESKTYEVLVDVCEGLTTTQVEKLKKLAENIEFTTPDEFEQKVLTLRESYFPSTVKSIQALDPVESNSSGEGMITEQLEGPMSRYVQALGKYSPPKRNN